MNNYLLSITFLAINWSNVIIATLVVAAIGLIIGIMLGIAALKLDFAVDTRELEVRELLPGVNCGACGYAGCDALAKAIAQEEAPSDACPVANSATHKLIADLMGQVVEEREPQLAYVNCAGTCEKAKDKYEYHGLLDCKAAMLVPGEGHKSCSFGCLGFGSCVNVCAFDAIHIIDGIALVDEEKCTACGMCVAECPKDLIELVPKRSEYFVTCISTAKGKDVRTVCSAGCIGCRLCVKACEYDAIDFNNNLAKIDYDKCVNCGECAKVCPVKVIKIVTA
ncbi:MAG TPA: RnfABCDGE type electron transport complex subunit B [Clostridiales bacterium]|nr:RnfABCDGE type electron transport complex subunit B [Clostridiales bacterium]